MTKLLIAFLFVFCFYSCKSGNDDITVSIEKPVPKAEVNSTIGKNIDRYLLGLEKLGFSGAIIVSQGEEMLLSKGYGLSNRETGEPYRSNTIQSCGSITKPFTAAAILLLENRGKLSVNDTITKYFNEVPEDKKNITLHQLLTHTSGLPGGIGRDEEPTEAQEYIDRAMSVSLQFSPGMEFGYSNMGYSLLALIIEKVSGQGYETFLSKELLLPSGLTETGYILPEWNREQMAVGYQKGERWGEIYERGWIEGGPNWHLRGNGGLHTTVDDMYKWFKTVKGQGILDEDVVKRWTTSYATENNGYSDYGYGWVIYDNDKYGKIITHNGSNGVFEATFVWLTEKDLFFYIQGNTSMFPSASQSSNILSAAFDSGFVMPPLVQKTDSAKAETAQKRTGKYQVNGGYMELTADDTRLFAKLTGQPVFDLMFGHSEEEKSKFANLTNRTRNAMKKLQKGQKDALSGMLGSGDDPILFTEPLLRLINQIGNLDTLHVIGTFENKPGSQFYDSGPYTTFVYAEFADWNQYWSLIWNEDETYKENKQGPWPTFVLIPIGEGQYRGVSKNSPWNMKEILFEDNCLIIEEKQVCIIK